MVAVLIEVVDPLEPFGDIGEVLNFFPAHAYEVFARSTICST